MIYNKPQIVSVMNATDAIQSVNLPDNQKQPGEILDAHGTTYCSPSAYEADE